MWFWAKKWKWQYITKCCFCCVSGYHDVDFWKLQNVEMLLAIFIFLISSMVKKLWLVEVEKGVRSSPIYDDFTFYHLPNHLRSICVWNHIINISSIFVFNRDLHRIFVQWNFSGCFWILLHPSFSCLEPSLLKTLIFAKFLINFYFSLPINFFED